MKDKAKIAKLMQVFTKQHPLKKSDKKSESIKVIDGKKYKAVKESKEPTKPTIHPFKETYKKIAKEFIKEAAWDRKFGEPLPTLEDVMKEADDDESLKGKMFNDPESGEEMSVIGGLRSTNPKTKQAAEKEKEKLQGDDSGSEKEDSGGKLGGSDFERDSDDKGDDDAGDRDSDEIDSQFPDSELAEKPFEHDDYDEEMEMEIADEITSYFTDNVDKVAKKDYTPEEMQDLVNAESEKLVAMYQKPNGVPNEKRNMLAYRNYLINHVKNTLGVKDREAGKESIKVINGKKYKALKESKKSTKPIIHSFKETYKKIGGK